MNIMYWYVYSRYTEKLCEWHKTYSNCVQNYFLSIQKQCKSCPVHRAKTLLYLRINLALGEKDLTATF
jgi:hypothetical protein